MVELHSLMQVSWQKGISLIPFYTVKLLALSPQQNNFIVSLKRQVVKRIL